MKLVRVYERDLGRGKRETIRLFLDGQWMIGEREASWARTGTLIGKTETLPGWQIVGAISAWYKDEHSARIFLDHITEDDTWDAGTKIIPLREYLASLERGAP